MEKDLIIDVGMHDGSDTAFYLAKGFRVVAVEANPTLIEAASERFSREIDSGRLTVVGAAITPSRGTTEMAIADDMTIWSSVDPAFINRNRGVGYRYVTVPTLPFSDVLAEHGVPYYLKVDIEGMDMLPIRALHGVSDRPRYVSIESTVTSTNAAADQVFGELAELWTLGYRGFKYVNQRLLPRLSLPREAREGRYVDVGFDGHTSGPFGRETPGRWLAAEPALAWAHMLRLKHDLGGYGGKWRTTGAGTAYAAARTLLLRREHSWYDLHARLPT